MNITRARTAGSLYFNY